MPKKRESYSFRNYYIPQRMMPGIRRYIDHGIIPGDFLTAVFENNLVNSLSLADDENLENIQAYAAYLYNEAPSMCWGSKEKMEIWMKNKKESREKKDGRKSERKSEESD